MEDDGKEKTLACNVCKNDVPVSHYSNKQLKLKGKRKCRDCQDGGSGTTTAAPTATATTGPTITEVKDSGFFTDSKSKNVVKTVIAADVMKAQERLKDGDVVNPDMDKFESLIKWLKEGGAKFPNLILKFYTVDYRGVHARRRLERDELILEVPLPLILTTEVAKELPIGVRIRESGCQLYSDHSWLASALLQEKYDPNSRWRAYIDCLPVHYRNMPLFFDEDELKWLKGSFTLKMIADRKFSLKLEYDNIVKHVPEFARYHHLDFMWARVAVITRVFGFEVRGLKTEGLVAMADMLNHKRPNETSWTFDDSLNAFTITTTKRLLKHAQIFDSYGRKCNSRFFVNYGFSLDFNEDNQVAVFFSIPREDPTYQLKAKLLGGTRQRRFQIAFEHKERCTKKCVSYLRIAYATPEELLPLTKLPDVSRIDPINVRNEAQCMQALAAQCEEVMRGFDTSLEEDNKMLEDPESKLTMNIRNCVIMRRGEKEILDAYIRLNEHIQTVKDMDARNLNRHFAKYIKGQGKEPTIAWRMEMYFQEHWIPLITGRKVELEEMNNSLGE